jgi:hypothetical protein
MKQIAEDSAKIAETYPTLAKENFKAALPEMEKTIIQIVGEATTSKRPLEEAEAMLDAYERNLDLIKQYAPDLAARWETMLKAQRGFINDYKKAGNTKPSSSGVGPVTVNGQTGMEQKIIPGQINIGVAQPASTAVNPTPEPSSGKKKKPPTGIGQVTIGGK